MSKIVRGNPDTLLGVLPRHLLVARSGQDTSPPQPSTTSTPPPALHLATMVVDLAFLEPLKELMADEQVKEVGRGLLEEVGRLSYSNSFIAINLWNYVLGAGLLVILGAVVLPLFGIDLLGTSYTAVAKAGYGNILPGSNDEVILQLQEKVG